MGASLADRCVGPPQNLPGSGITRAKRSIRPDFRVVYPARGVRSTGGAGGSEPDESPSKARGRVRVEKESTPSRAPAGIQLRAGADTLRAKTAA